MKKDEAYILRRVNVSLKEPFNKIEEFKSYVEKNINDSNLKQISPKSLAAYFALLSKEALDKDSTKSPLHEAGNHDSRIDFLRSMITKGGVNTFKLALYLNEFDSDFLTSVEDIMNIGSLDLSNEFKTFSTEDRALYEKYCFDKEDSSLDKSRIFPLDDSGRVSLSRRLVEFSSDQLKGIWDCVREEGDIWNFDVESLLSYKILSAPKRHGDNITNDVESESLNNILIKHLVINRVLSTHNNVESFSSSLNKSLESEAKQREMQGLFIVDGVEDQSALDSLRSLLVRKANCDSSKKPSLSNFFSEKPNREKYSNIESFIERLGSAQRSPDIKR